MISKFSEIDRGLWLVAWFDWLRFPIITCSWNTEYTNRANFLYLDLSASCLHQFLRVTRFEFLSQILSEVTLISASQLKVWLRQKGATISFLASCQHCSNHQMLDCQDNPSFQKSFEIRCYFVHTKDWTVQSHQVWLEVLHLLCYKKRLIELGRPWLKRHMF